MGLRSARLVRHSGVQFARWRQEYEWLHVGYRHDSRTLKVNAHLYERWARLIAATLGKPRTRNKHKPVTIILF